ncbi:MAG: hypothetical protein QOD58_491, partial [Mycobacterium sp.]|nr:hypothetical protein [Mycobacterium sp.]
MSAKIKRRWRQRALTAKHFDRRTRGQNSSTEPVRNQSRQSGMRAQRPRHEIGAAAGQAILKQAVGQQVGGNHDAARTSLPGVGDGLAHGRRASRGET